MFKHKLRDLRKEHHLSQKDLAEILKCSVASICLMENGQRQPSAELLTKLSNYFQVSIDWLIQDKEIAIKDRLQENTITVIGRNGTYRTFALNEEKLKEIEMLAEEISKKCDN